MTDQHDVLDTPGDGQAPAAPGRRLGLRGMAERARLAGGRLDLESEPGRGTTVYLSVPLQPKES